MFRDSRLRKLIERHEGRRTKVYHDFLSYPTIGVGFNLLRPDAAKIFSDLGIDYLDVMAGKRELTDSEVDAILDVCLKQSIEDAKDIIENFDKLDDVRKMCVIDLVFNLGKNKFSQFIGTIEHIIQGKFDIASLHLSRTLWFKQTKLRGIRICGMLLDGVYPL